MDDDGKDDEMGNDDVDDETPSLDIEGVQVANSTRMREWHGSFCLSRRRRFKVRVSCTRSHARQRGRIPKCGLHN